MRLATILLTLAIFIPYINTLPPQRLLLGINGTALSSSPTRPLSSNQEKKTNLEIVVDIPDQPHNTFLICQIGAYTFMPAMGMQEWIYM